VVSKPALLIMILSAISAPAATPRITNPVNFVAEVYGHFLKAQSTDKSYEPPEDIFTTRLSKLILDDRKRAKGEVGCLDFDFWINGQDWTITNLSVTGGAAEKDRQTVIARFQNLGTPEEIHFDFLRIDGRWLLDEVQSIKGDRWTLSAILKCAP
jgi:hypothetical protein